AVPPEYAASAAATEPYCAMSCASVRPVTGSTVLSAALVAAAAALACRCRITYQVARPPPMPTVHTCHVLNWCPNSLISPAITPTPPPDRVRTPRGPGPPAAAPGSGRR